METIQVLLWECKEAARGRAKTPDAWFRLRLYDLIMKADNHNLERLRKVYPMEVAVFEYWKSGTPIPKLVLDEHGHPSDREMYTTLAEVEK